MSRRRARISPDKPLASHGKEDLDRRCCMDDQVRYYKAKLQYEIDPWDLNEALGRGDKIHLVDTRSPEAYGKSHIPGAINIPHRTMSTATTAHLDKGALIVTY